MAQRNAGCVPLIVGTAAVVVTAVTAVLWYGVHGRAAQVFGRSVYRGPAEDRAVALTFDDGPSEGTAALLALLAEQGVLATFFQCGLNAERHPAWARAVSDAGHEIGNHTYTHARLAPRLSRSPNLLGPRTVGREMEQGQAALQQIHGAAPRWFRAPYGMRWWGVGQAQRRLRLVGVHWTVIGHDWEWPAERIVAHLLRHVRPGAILCLHDGRDIQQNVDISEALRAVRLLVPALRQQGYRFKTLSDLLRPVCEETQA